MESLSPNLMVENVNQTVVFYEEVLGFQLVGCVPEEGVFNWAMMSNGNAVVMFQTRESLTEELQYFENKPIGGTFTLYIKLKNIEDYFSKIKDKVQVLKHLDKTFYGSTEFSIADINGYVLTFAGADE